MITINKQIHLASRPDGEPTVANFRLVEAPLPTLRENQVLVRRQCREMMREHAGGAPSQAVLGSGQRCQEFAMRSLRVGSVDLAQAPGGRSLH